MPCNTSALTRKWPTLASLVEERLRDDPPAIHAVVHALNEWMHEHWTYNYADAMYPTPMISLSVLDEALKELEFVVANGAKAFLLHTAPVPTWKGRMSFALPVFDLLRGSATTLLRRAAEPLSIGGEVKVVDVAALED